jgi:hypothetical protein
MMKETPSNSWKPTPELLAAYGDGELEGREQIARVEAYLAGHPEAQAELAAQRRLRHLWDETTPAEPTTAAWQRTFEGVASAPRRVAPRPTWWAFGAVVVAACVVWALVAVWRTPPPTVAPTPVEPFPVAHNDEVEILRIDGDDLASIVVGRLPLLGVLELAESGDVEVTNVQPAQGDNMRPMMPVVGRRPMIWAKVESEP